MTLSKQTKIISVVIIALVLIILAAVTLKIKSQQEVVETEIATNNPAPSGDLTNLFDNPESHYHIRYPIDWVKEDAGPGTVVFSGKSGTNSFYSTVNVQAILSKKSGGDYASINDFVTDIKHQAHTQSTNVRFLEDKPFSLADAEGKKMNGRSLLFTYNYKNIPFKQWQIVAYRNDEQVFYAWAYTAPLAQYDNDYVKAKAMLDSWSIY